MNVEALPSEIVVDASVGMKWVIAEAGSELAARVPIGRKMYTSALFWAEVANVLASKVRRGEIDRAASGDAIRDLVAAPIATFPIEAENISRALELAHDLAHPIYDCHYLLVAQVMDTMVVTADRRFRDVVSKHPALSGRVVLLDDIKQSP